jgi:putative transposase
MPDHLHLLVEGLHEHSDLKWFQRGAKQYSGFHYNKQFGCVLWQRYAFERVLRSQELTLDVARYILTNPIRAGLAPTIDGYPFSGCEVSLKASWREVEGRLKPAPTGRA